LKKFIKKEYGKDNVSFINFKELKKHKGNCLTYIGSSKKRFNQFLKKTKENENGR
jgi:hypothetical protein